MTTTNKKLMTADELLRLYSQGVRGELIRGVLCETSPATALQGKTAVLIVYRLMNFVRPQRLGNILGTDVGIWLERDPDTVREPDIAYYSAGRLPLNDLGDGYVEIAPDLAVEFASLDVNKTTLNDRCRMWLSYGTPLVWEVDPVDRTIGIHRIGVPVVTLTEDDVLDGGDIIPGFSCLVREIFDY